jgi:hypothetical protein
VLTAAAGAGARRVVCTSSLDVITRNRATVGRQRTEADWSDPAECAIPPLHLAFTDVHELGWTPRPLRQSILETAESLISAGVVRPRKPVTVA